MKTYSKRPWWSHRTTKKEYGARSATEWDGSLKLTEAYSTLVIETKLDSLWKSGLLTYVLVGGVEVDSSSEHSKEAHVHIAIILPHSMTRREVITLCEWGDVGAGLYLTPRNVSYPYVTWRLHHIKTQTKVMSSPSLWLLLERGSLPKDTDEALREKRPFLIRFMKRYEVSDLLFDTNAFLQRLDIICWTAELEELKATDESDLKIEYSDNVVSDGLLPLHKSTQTE